ncbi:MAG: hypothetical protein K2Y01_02990 [Rhabdochlamydiaceae bacterium]|nr:hypothetical protein [Rhabdochlamydiaceae bacterium]
MFQKWFLLFISFFSFANASLFMNALDSLKDNPYGFYFFDTGITQNDLKDFQAIKIEKEKFYQQFGELSKTESGITDFLNNLGQNDHQVTLRIAKVLTQISNQVLTASESETAWIHLRASVPTDTYDIPRWHMDGLYFRPIEPTSTMYRFVITLLGPATLFYLLPQEQRETAWKNMRYRTIMQTFCLPERVVRPNIGEGVFL